MKVSYPHRLVCYFVSILHICFPGYRYFFTNWLAFHQFYSVEIFPQKTKKQEARLRPFLMLQVNLK